MILYKRGHFFGVSTSDSGDIGIMWCGQSKTVRKIKDVDYTLARNNDRLYAYLAYHTSNSAAIWLRFDYDSTRCSIRVRPVNFFCPTFERSTNHAEWYWTVDELLPNRNWIATVWYRLRFKRKQFRCIVRVSGFMALLTNLKWAFRQTHVDKVDTLSSNHISNM